MIGCPQCGSTAVRWTGTLGALDWNACRYCGAQYATTAMPRGEGGLDENGDALPPDEQAWHEAQDEYLATCYGHQASENDESTRDQER
jgi:hypothetical protein